MNVLELPTTTVALTWREKTVIRILCVVALILSQDEAITREVRALATHIAVSRDET